ncbi:MAG: hypothetical protein R3F50_08050 [Gammaproteobacteria bacterium]|jgi:hypothetical protein
MATEQEFKVQELDDRLIFGNLRNAGSVLEETKHNVSASKPSTAVQRGNAKGDLREIKDFQEAADLGTEAAEEFKAILKL